jgi:glycosyltransferase involved in cell wall biosynthesis
MRWVEGILSEFTDHIVCVSHAEKAEADSANINPGKCRVIENGLPPLPVAVVDRMIAERRNRSGPLQVLFVGRFDRQKGFDVFLEVMRALGGAAQATAIGDYLLSSTPRPPCPANVTLLDWQPQSALAGHYAQADLLVMPSRWEGLPFVALEGMRAGLAVFATRAGGLSEAVVDASTGVCFEIDEPAEMARRIAQTSRAQLAAMGARGVERFRSFYTADRMNRRLLELYAMPTRRWPFLAPAVRPAGAATPLALPRPAEDNVSLQDRAQPAVGPLPWPE